MSHSRQFMGQKQLFFAESKIIKSSVSDKLLLFFFYLFCCKEKYFAIYLIFRLLLHQAFTKQQKINW